LNEEHSAILVKVNPEGIQPLMIELLDLRQWGSGPDSILASNFHVFPNSSGVPLMTSMKDKCY
jgi:hypothetical protein